MKKALLLIFLSPFCNSSENLLWLGYSQNKSDFFGDGSSKIKPEGSSIGWATDVSDNWALTLSYAEQEGDVITTIFENNQIRLDNQGSISSNSTSIGLSWLADDYSVSFSFSQIDNQENSLTRLPLVVEEVIGDDQVFSVSYDALIELESWIFGWSVGTQISKSSVSVSDVIGSDNPIIVEADFDSENISAFLDVDLSFPIKNSSFTLTPMLTFSWATDVTSSGDELVTVIRGDQRQTFTQLSDRLSSSFRTPDSGFWETAVEIEWNNGWSATLAYGQSIAADTDIDSLVFDVSVSF